MDSPPVTRLQPPLSITAGRKLTLQSAFTPTGSSIVLAPSALAGSETEPSTSKQTQVLYAAKYNASNGIERKEFVVQCYTLFASLQKIASDYSAIGYDGEPVELTSEQMQYLHRLCSLYTQAVVSQFAVVQADSSLSPAALGRQLTHFASLHSLFSLTSVLYLPSDGVGLGIVGEELLDWVNTVDRAPSKEEGEAIVGLARPWESDGFWEYLQRCLLRAHVLSLTTLLAQLASHHPSPLVQQLAEPLASLIEDFPRSSSPSFRTESEFLSALRRWKRQSSAARQAAEKQVEQDTQADETEQYEAAQLLSLFALADGDEESLLEASEDWREALGAWGVWVNGGGRREGLPETLQLILKTHPLDSTLPSEAAQVSLILGDVTRALQQAATISSFLPAHLSDLLHHAGVLPSPPLGSGLPSLRSYFLLEYAESLLGDEGLWRVTCEYLAAEGGEEGLSRLRAVLGSVNLVDLPAASKADGPSLDGTDMEVEGAGPQDEEKEPSTVEEVLRLCSELGLEAEMRQICKVYSAYLLAEQRYGEAISFSIRAGDTKRIGRIADDILEQYVVNGQEAFIRHVDSIPTSLLRPHDRSDSDDGMSEDGELAPLAPYSAKLSFLARYRDFFAYYARGDRRQAAALLVLLLTSGVAPKAFHAVMLLDVLPLLSSSSVSDLLVTPAETYELLRILEELTAPISATGSDIYGHLEMLARLMDSASDDGETKERRSGKAVKQLEVVRGELARHLAKCCCL